MLLYFAEIDEQWVNQIWWNPHPCILNYYVKAYKCRLLCFWELGMTVSFFLRENLLFNFVFKHRFVIVGLHKILKGSVLDRFVRQQILIRYNFLAQVIHWTCELNFVKLQRHRHLPVNWAKFDCVWNEIDQNLNDTTLVTENLLVVTILVFRDPAENQFNVFEVCTWLQSWESKIYGILKAEVAIGEREGIVLNLSKVK